jgi:hypothetical protein
MVPVYNWCQVHTIQVFYIKNTTILKGIIFMDQQNTVMDIGLDGPEQVQYTMLIDQIYHKCQD